MAKQDWSTRLKDVWVLSIDSSGGDLILRVFASEETLLRAMLKDMRETLAKDSTLDPVHKKAVEELLERRDYETLVIEWQGVFNETYAWEELLIEGL